MDRWPSSWRNPSNQTKLPNLCSFPSFSLFLMPRWQQIDEKNLPCPNGAIVFAQPWSWQLLAPLGRAQPAAFGAPCDRTHTATQRTLTTLCFLSNRQRLVPLNWLQIEVANPQASQICKKKYIILNSTVHMDRIFYPCFASCHVSCSRSYAKQYRSVSFLRISYEDMLNFCWTSLWSSSTGEPGPSVSLLCKYIV